MTTTDTQNYLGIDLGGTKIAVAILSGETIVHKLVVPTPTTGFEAVAAAMIAAGQQVMQESNTQVAAIGVGVPGPIDFKTGTIIFAPNIYGLENAAVKARLEQGFSRPVELENDANAAGLAEHVLGAARVANSSIFITVSTGIGGGIIFNNRVWRGANGIAGEIGHISSLPGGPLAGSGVDGALEAVASGSAIARDASFALNKTISTREAFELAQAGNPKALKIINLAARHLGIGIADMQKVLDPEMFVLGGGVSEVGAFFLDKVQAAAEEHAGQFAPVKIQKAMLGGDAGVIGAALSAKHAQN